jgi:hypothetical protein
MYKALSLEQLDKKVGRVHTIDDWRRVGEKADRAPGSLTDDDLVIITAFEGERAGAQARARRETALSPPAPPPAPAAPVKRTAEPDVDRLFDVVADFIASDAAHGERLNAVMDYIKAYPRADLVLPLLAWARGSNRKNQERNQKIATLEAKIVTLEAEQAQIKATAFMKDAGVWRHGSVYSPGDVATFKGSAWVCTKAHTADGPVADHANWRLLMKGGTR